MRSLIATALLTGFDTEGIRALRARAVRNAQDSAGEVIVFVDRALLSGPGPTYVLDTLTREQIPTSVHPVSGFPTIDAVLEDARLLRGFSAVLALGGGSVIDRAKLARAAAEGADLQAATSMAPGHAVLETARSRLPLIAMPTTLGTGSERNSNAVLAAGDRRFLVSGSVLLPEAAVLEPALTRSLSAAAVLSGVFEALARTLEPYASPTTQAGADQLALATAGRLAVLGDAVASGPSGPAAEETRLEIARLSGLSHAPAMHAGRAAFAFPGWFLAHELASVTGVSKVGCLAALLPAIDRRARADARVWGAPRRRAAASMAVLSALGLPSGDESALAVLAQRWSLVVPLGDIDVEALATRILSAWGPPSPHLARVGRDELVAVLTEATDATRAPIAPRAPISPRAAEGSATDGRGPRPS
ncbi:hypothetical protein C5C18_13890 [Rathayibacter tritici]|uniref:Alcohol dehydrogenase iron-type/glycerol dehydrogenase GldA domain-containing protein n=1 Tax=Rathayibacter tritici TaxID=33888 RepID=A0A160KR42_9MICO|nr:iron-containing alcohol dehydrogenase [Rathayibacter tritici]AND16070.1 hypothetical protein A6122_0917 [Rathayibacter tritici]PPF24465.1 hypothetical protein C5C06_13010 [Rathayibacter tritici]PPF63239.1 hypothetical protein C5C21_13295 [Rathayibacter tritici]PPG04104.1 hypothetical protein C5C18_13890 [Rathayibacter tritici]PPI12350.1 hypothetical protein C5D07_13160 [Rathayibacter tritici]